MSRREEPTERAERLLAELRTATAEAAGVVKDLRKAMKEAREQIDEYYSAKVKASLDEHTAMWTDEIDQWWSDAKTDVKRITAAAVARSNEIIYAAATIEQLCQAVATEVAAHTVYTEEGPVIHYDVDHRGTDQVEP